MDQSTNDIYRRNPDELARFYAERFRTDAGPKAAEMVQFNIRDAEAANDGQRAGFWRKVLQLTRR
jgi:hypothetical protein